MLMSSVTVNRKNLIFPSVQKLSVQRLSFDWQQRERKPFIALSENTALPLSYLLFPDEDCFLFFFEGLTISDWAWLRQYALARLKQLGENEVAKFFIIILSGVPKCTLYAPLIFCAGQVSKRKILPHYQHIQNHITLPLPIFTAI